MTAKLSIILPCYNCCETLEEALASIYDQDLTIPHEVIMVDDGSTDRTRALMETLREKYKTANIPIRLFFHDKNMGGGAARNTAVTNSTAPVIFCLDSDDILPPRMLSKMYTLLKEKKCDGVLFQETHFFENTNINRINILKNNVSYQEPIHIDALFTDGSGFLTQVNFMYTKEAWETLGGYPTDHAFDTQSFGFKFLAHNLTSYICPDTYYLHRRGTIKSSYFEKAYINGDLSKNTYLVIEDIVSVLSDQTIRAVITYDIFKNNQLGTENLHNYLNTLYAKNPRVFFRKNNGRTDHHVSPEELFIKAIYLFKRGLYADAVECYSKIMGVFPRSGILRFNIFRNIEGITGTDPRDIIREVEKNVAGMISVKRRKMRLVRKYRIIILLVKKIAVYASTSLMTMRKIYRYSKSAFISLFCHRVDKKEFYEMYYETKRQYLEASNLYDYSDFVMPQWLENTKKIESYFLNDFSFAFLRNPVIKQTMFMYTLRKWKNIQKKLILEFFTKREAREILREYATGKPLMNDVGLVTSGNNIHHLYHAIKFFKETRTNAVDFRTVVEVGGGYGNMAKLFKKLNPHVTYIIIDIPIFSYLQMLYLKTLFGKDSVHLVNIQNMNIKNGMFNVVPLDKKTLSPLGKIIGAADLFISTWALSESNKTMQDCIKDLEYFKSRYLLMAYQKFNTTFLFAEDIKNIHDAYQKIFECKTEYVADSSYLFCKRK